VKNKFKYLGKRKRNVTYIYFTLVEVSLYFEITLKYYWINSYKKLNANSLHLYSLFTQTQLRMKLSEND